MTTPKTTPETTPEINCEKKLTRSNTWKIRKKKLKNLGYATAISSVFLLPSCGPTESETTKTSKIHDNDVETVESAKENLATKEEAMKQATIDLQDARQALIDAEKKEQKSKNETKQKANNL